MKKLRLANKIITTLIKDQWYYRGRVIADMILMFVRCGVLLVLYAYVFRLKNGVINDTTFAVVAWSIFFYFAFITLRLREITRMIMQDVRSGVVETLFVKPMSYIFYRMMWQLGSGISSFVIVSVCGSALLIWWVGIPETMTIGIFLPTLFAIFCGAIILTLTLYAIVGFMAFWIEDVNPIFWLVDKVVMVLGGSYLPVALFPPLLYKVAVWSPFGAASFITHTVNVSWQEKWSMLIGIQIMWISIGLVVLFMINRYAHKRVSINGG
jgi:ABC-2 type transport system permease protein